MLLHVLKREKLKTIAVKTKERCITQALPQKRFRQTCKLVNGSTKITQILKKKAFFLLILGLDLKIASISSLDTEKGQ